MKWIGAVSWVLFLAATGSAGPIATYQFNGTYNANEGGIPALSPVIGTGGAATFSTDTVFGSTRSIVNLQGSPGTNLNTGLQLANATGVIPGSTYSVEFVFQFTQNPSGFRKIEDVSNRGSDNGFYAFGDKVTVFGDGLTGPVNSWTNLVYHHVVLTEGGGNVAVYVDGVQDFSGPDTVMIIPAGNALSLFIDDASNVEYSSSKVALVRLFDSTLTQGDVTTLFNNGSPVDLQPPATGTPEPSTAALLTAGLGLGGLLRRRYSRR